MSINKRNSGNSSHFNNIERAPYELPQLIRQLPSSLSKLSTANNETRQIAEAATIHAKNAGDTVLFGLEAIGKLIFIANANDDHELDRVSMANLGALITHLAVEAQAMQQTASDLRHALDERPLKIVGGRV